MVHKHTRVLFMRNLSLTAKLHGQSEKIYYEMNE